MTDEEMADKHAEEYRKTFRYYRAWHGQVVDKSPSTIVVQSFKDGFLAGLKAGRPQWHKITDWEDNSQFPKDELKTYLVRLYQDHYVICELDITEGYRQFYLPDNLEFVDPQDVIAWCEIPTFDKE